MGLGFKRMALLLLLLITATGYISAQHNNKLIGRVVDENREPIGFFNISIHEIADTAFINGDIGQDGKLLLTHNQEGDYLIRISSLGYQDTYILTELGRMTDVGTIVVNTVAYGISELIVTGNRNIVRSEKGKIVVQVVNTPLEHLYSTKDILRRAPGMQVVQGQLTVFGRGAPDIYIDGKKVQSMAEIEILKPADILSFRLDRNPSAKYGASTTAVVEIRTNRKIKERVSLNLSNTSIFGRKFTNISGMSMNINTKKTKSYIGYSFLDSDNRDNVFSYDYNYLPNYILRNETSRTQRYSTQSHTVLLGTSIMLNHKNELSFQYYVKQPKSYSKSNDHQLISKGEDIDRELQLYSSTNNKQPQHVANITYKLEPDSMSRFTISTNYTHFDAKSKQSIIEDDITNPGNYLKNINNYNNANLVVGKSEYSTTIFKNYEFLVGVRYGHIGASNDMEFVDHSDESKSYSDKYKMSENIIASYFTLTRDYSKIGYELGLRYEAAENYAKIDDDIIRDKWEHDLFPSFMVYSNNWSDKFDLSLSYTNKISRPTIGQLNPSLNYINNLTYAKGNPYLISAKTHYISLSATFFNSLIFNIEYTYRKNPVVKTGISDENDPEILIFTPINIPKSYQWGISLSYNKRWKWFSMNLATGLEMPSVTIPFLGESQKRNAKSWYINYSSDFTISKSTFVTVDFDYASRWYDLTTRYNRYYDLTLTLMQYALKKKLAFTVSVNDILRKSYSDWEDRYVNVITGVRRSMDSRYILFSIRFSLNNLKSKYKERSEGGEELRRVK